MSLMGSPQWMYKSEDFTIDQSLRFYDDNTPHLTRTPASAGNRKTWTWSGWAKKVEDVNGTGTTHRQIMFAAGTGSSDADWLEFGWDGQSVGNSDKFYLGSLNNSIETTAKFRDYSGWYHIVVAADTTQATATDRFKVYVNGVDQSLGNLASISQNDDTAVNAAVLHKIGATSATTGREYNGYLAEVYLIDGTALTPSSFGETGTYGEWKPKEYSGTYGTNGFYLPFKSDYEVEGFSANLYKGTSAIQYIGGVGFQPDLVWTKIRSGNGMHEAFDSIRGATKRLRPEIHLAETTDANSVTAFKPDGFTLGSSGDTNHGSHTYVAWCWDMGGGTGLPVALTANGNVAHSTTQQKMGATSIAFDGTGDYVSALDNDKWDLSSDFTIEFWVYPQTDDNYNVFFGQQVDDNNKWIIAKGGSGKIQLGFRTGGTWIFGEGASGTDAERLMGASSDCPLNSWTHIAVTRRGNKWTLWSDGDEVCSSSSNTTATFAAPLYIGQASTWGNATGYMDEIRISNKCRYTSAFTAPTSAFSNDDNTLLLIHSDTTNGSTTFTDSAGATKNTTGTITSYVAANTTYGQSIVSYSGNSTSGATVGHGLGTVPEMVIVKAVNTSESWAVYHANNTAAPETDRLRLDADGATVDDATIWNDTAPTSSVFTIGNDNQVNNSSYNYIAYCFDSVAGYSKFGGYTGDGGSSNTITTGFKPAFVMIKNASTAARPWVMFDTVRSPGLVWNDYLVADDGALETVDNTNRKITVSDTGFTLGIDAYVNENTASFVYMAFADKREYAYWLDQSGNNHDWTSTHLTESDISVDSPTNNFCTWNPLTKGAYALAWTEGNLKVNSSADWSGTLGTFAVTSGKWYWEISEGDQTDAEQSVHIGVVVDDVEQDHQTFQALSGSVAYQANGNLRVDGSASGVGTYATYYTTDIIGVALDLDSGTNTVKFFKNNVLQGTTNLPSSFTGKAVVPFVSAYQHYIMANFGQDSSFAGHKSAQGNQDGNEVGDFYYTPPSGYLALCTSNLAAATVTPSEHFGVVTYTGDGNSTQAITTDFQPDLVWVKNRNSGNQATINDVLRGFAAANTMRPNETDNESTFGSNAATYGFTDDVSSTSITVNKGSGTGDYVNRSSYTYAAWLWKAGGSGSSNTNGTINTTATSANTDAGFSISTYTGTGSNATIGHGLTKAPEVVIVKERAADAGHWYVWHTGFANTHGMYLNASTGITESDTYWNDTSPTSTVFSIGTNSDINGNTNTYVAYCFHSVDGYSKFGKYIGNNNNDGPFIYLGFRPKYFMLKASSTTDSWLIYDSAREPYNEDANADLMLRADNDAAESEYGNLDFCSNGVKIRISASAMNEAHTYIYLAFAETPFKYANAR